MYVVACRLSYVCIFKRTQRQSQHFFTRILLPNVCLTFLTILYICYIIIYTYLHTTCKYQHFVHLYGAADSYCINTFSCFAFRLLVWKHDRRIYMLFLTILYTYYIINIYVQSLLVSISSIMSLFSSLLTAIA